MARLKALDAARSSERVSVMSSVACATRSSLMTRRYILLDHAGPVSCCGCVGLVAPSILGVACGRSACVGNGPLGRRSL